MTSKNNGWIVAGIFGFVFLSFFFNSGLRKTWERRKAILEARGELASVTSNIERLEADIALLKQSPRAYEKLVRRELGYLKSGEKEIRFLKVEN